MSQSLSKLYVHIVFHINTKSPNILQGSKSELYAYIGTIIKDNGSTPIIINGVSDHIHILCVLSKNIALSQLVEEIKKHSSRWLKTRNQHYAYFSWQGGYGAFSVSASVQKRMIQYIEKQEEHHKNLTFREEYVLFLKEYNVEYHEEYLWTD